MQCLQNMVIFCHIFRLKQDFWRKICRICSNSWDSLDCRRILQKWYNRTESEKKKMGRVAGGASATKLRITDLSHGVWVLHCISWVTFILCINDCKFQGHKNVENWGPDYYTPNSIGHWITCMLPRPISQSLWKAAMVLKRPDGILIWPISAYYLLMNNSAGQFKNK